jgi:hypothetical protein
MKKKNILYVILPAVGLTLTTACSPNRPTAADQAQTTQVQTSNPSVTAAAQTQQQNTLTAEEKRLGWKLLFDGKSTNGWRSYRAQSVKPSWAVEDGNLVVLGKQGAEAGDLITNDQYENFELKLQWKNTPGGNSGLMFNVVEGDNKETYYSGPEFQLIDDTGYEAHHNYKLTDKQVSGANYDIHTPVKKAVKPVGEWNDVRLRVVDGHVEHWLNGEKVVDYHLWSDDWKNLVQQSKFKDWPYGQARKGHIALQDHGTQSYFRNIKIRPLPPGEPIFNGRDLTGWNIHGTEKWYVEEGLLVCESGPDKGYGYLATEKPYGDFEMTLEFKQEANGNSGVFFRSSLEGTKITGWQVEVAPPNHDTGGIYESYGRGWLVQIPEEKENILRMGEWNKMKIRVVGDRATTWLNGQQMVDLQDEKIGATPQGKIALQIHDGGGIKVRWRNLLVREMLPESAKL